MSDADDGRQRTQLWVKAGADRRRATLMLGGRHQDARPAAGSEGRGSRVVGSMPGAAAASVAGAGEPADGFHEASAVFAVASPDAGHQGAMLIANGALAFARELRASTSADTAGSLARLRSALRRERARGRAGHWTYDLARHLRLVRDVRHAEAAVRAASIATAVQPA